MNASAFPSLAPTAAQQETIRLRALSLGAGAHPHRIPRY